MSVGPPSVSRWRRGLSSGFSLVSGASLAVVPAAVLSLSANTFALGEQGALAFSVTAATFVGQLVFSAVVEARLGTNRAAPLAIPTWLSLGGGIATIALALAPLTPWLAIVALPIVLAALEVGRGVSVIEDRVGREVYAAVAVGLGSGVGVLLGILGLPGGFTALAGGILVAIVIRAWGLPTRMDPPDPGIRRWIVVDVGLTGVAYPALNATILTLLGPLASTLFAAISTVSGLLAIPLNFLRARLLRRHGSLDIVVTVLALMGAASAIGLAEWTGFLGLAFGETWTISATVGPLLCAGAWRVAAVFSALPFAALRRAGRARLVTVLRGSSAVITFALAVAATTSGEIWVVFAALTVGELILALACEVARRRIHAHTSDRMEQS